jgi:hypothetical protein
MAEPKKETVRIALPRRPEQASSGAGTVKRDTARIVLPSRSPVTPIRRLPPKITPLPAAEAAAEPTTVAPRRPPTISPSPAASSPLLQPLPKPPGVEKEAAVRPVPVRETAESSAPSVNRGPKKETARISILPRPASSPKPTINMTKTQPLVIHPAPGIQPAPVIITSKPVAPADVIPRSLSWTIFAISAVIFLIQIWNYVVS